MLFAMLILITRVHGTIFMLALFHLLFLLPWLLLHLPDTSMRRLQLSIFTNLLLKFTLLCLALLVVLPLTNMGLPNLIKQSTVGFDDSTHIFLTQADTQSSGFVLKPTIKGLAAYPQGWHYVTSLFLSGTETYIGHGDLRTTLAVYRVMNAIWWLSLLLLALCLILVASGRNNRKPINFGSQILISGCFVVLYAVLIYPNIAYAATSFIATITLLTALFITLLLRGNTEDLQLKRFLWVVSCALAVATTYTWILSGLIAICALILALLAFHDPTRPKKLFEELRKYRFELFGAIPAIAAAGVQVLIEAHYGSKATITAIGGIIEPNHLLFLVLALVTVFVLARRGKGDFAYSNADLLSLFSTPYILVLLVYAIQMWNVGTLTYYYSKVAYIAYFFLFLLFAAVISDIFRNLEQGAQRTRNYLSVVLVAILIVAFNVNTHFIFYALHREGAATKPLASKMAELITAGVPAYDIVVFTENTYQEDVLSDHFLVMVSPTTPPTRWKLNEQLIQNDTNAFLKTLQTYANRSVPTYILVSSNSKNLVEKSLRAGNYKVILAD